MSLSINTNVAALGVLNNLEASDSSLQTTIQRLSSGLRINSPADGPADFVISQGMKNQIAGMTQATQNTQTAINLAKTAGGAMGQIETLLQTLRGLAVSSANQAVVDSTAQQADQSQAQSIIQSINQIASSATFGTQNLLDGTAGTQANITDGTAVSSLYIGSTFGGARVQSGPVTVTAVTQATEAQLNGNVTYALPTTAIGAAGSITLNGQTIPVSATDSIQQVVAKINGLTGTTGVSAQLVLAAGHYTVQLAQTSYGSQYGINLTDPGHVLNSTSTSSLTGTDGVFNVSATTSQGVQTVAFTGGQSSGATGLQLTDGQGDTLALTAAGNTSLGAATQVGTLTAGSLQFQIGAAASQSVTLSLPSMFANAIGTGAIAGQSISTLDLSSTAGATNAINIIDAAISQVSTAEGQVGSFQANVLQPASSNLGIASQNASSAESTIADADIALESTNLSKEPGAGAKRNRDPGPSKSNANPDARTAQESVIADLERIPPSIRVYVELAGPSAERTYRSSIPDRGAV